MYKEMAAHESTRNTKLSDKKRLTRDEVDGISIDRHNRFFTETNDDPDPLSEPPIEIR